MILSLIAAYAKDEDGRWVIGKDNRIPWDYPHDLRRFRDYTSGSAIIMGRKTHESIGRVLPKRTNLILSRQEDYEVPGALVFQEFDAALDFAQKGSAEVFVIGGQQVYELAIHRADRLYLTNFKISDIEGDAFFPDFDTSHFKSIHQESTESDFFLILQRIKRGDEPEPEMDHYRSNAWYETVYPLSSSDGDPYDPDYIPIPGEYGRLA